MVRRRRAVALEDERVGALARLGVMRASARVKPCELCGLSCANSPRVRKRSSERYRHRECPTSGESDVREESERVSARDAERDAVDIRDANDDDGRSSDVIRGRHDVDDVDDDDKINAEVRDDDEGSRSRAMERPRARDVDERERERGGFLSHFDVDAHSRDRTTSGGRLQFVVRAIESAFAIAFAFVVVVVVVGEAIEGASVARAAIAGATMLVVVVVEVANALDDFDVTSRMSITFRRQALAIANKVRDGFKAMKAWAKARESERRGDANKRLDDAFNVRRATCERTNGMSIDDLASAEALEREANIESPRARTRTTPSARAFDGERLDVVERLTEEKRAIERAKDEALTRLDEATVTIEFLRDALEAVDDARAREKRRLVELERRAAEDERTVKLLADRVRVRERHLASVEPWMCVDQ